MSSDGGWHIPNEATAPVLGFLGVVFGVVVTFLGKLVLGKTAFETMIHTGFANLAAKQQAENAILRQELNEERLARQELRGEVNQCLAMIDVRDRILRHHNIPIPEPRHQVKQEMVVLYQGPPTGDGDG